MTLKTGLISTSILAGLLLLGITGYVLTRDDSTSEENKDDTTITEDLSGETSMPAPDFEENTESIAKLENALELATGTSTGNSVLVDELFVFDDTTLIIDQETMAMSLDAKGFDLGSIGNPNLQIEEDVYPLMEIVMSGLVEKDGSNILARVDSFTPVFYTAIDGTPLAEQASLAIINEMESLGLVFPNVTEADPLILPLSLSLDPLSGVVLEATEDATVVFEFREEAF